MYRLLPHFIQAGSESPSRSAIVLGELPLPNQSTLQILLETLHRWAAYPPLLSCPSRCLWRSRRQHHQEGQSTAKANTAMLSGCKGHDKAKAVVRTDLWVLRGCASIHQHGRPVTEETRGKAQTICMRAR